MTVLELTPRVSVSQLKELPSWPEMKAKRKAAFSIVVEGRLQRFEVKLTSWKLTFGRRWAFKCCGGREHLYLVSGRPVCRICGRLSYLRHSWGAGGGFRDEVGRPLLALARRSRRPS